jgi:hypothetical protein
MENEGLQKVFDGLERGETPDFLTMMLALVNVSKLMTIDTRPAEPAQPLTLCELNGRCNCND